LHNTSTNSKDIKRYKKTSVNFESQPKHAHNTQDCENPSLNYCEMNGSLLHLILGTWLDIAFSVGLLARFQVAANKSHFKGVQRCLKYLKGTQNLSLVI
jgi:hypothetical protein